MNTTLFALIKLLLNNKAAEEIGPQQIKIFFAVKKDSSSVLVLIHSTILSESFLTTFTNLLLIYEKFYLILKYQITVMH